MRLFVAVVPPPDVVEHLEEFLEPRRDVEGPRWTLSSQWHLTLAFAGAAPARVAEPLVEEVALAAARHAPVAVSLTGGGCFPDVVGARLLYAGVDGGAALEPLALAVRSACAVVGAAPDGGRWRAHLSLARFPRPVDATRWVRLLDTYAGPAWTASEVVVVESHLPRERGHRARHEVLATLPLGG